MSSDLDKARSRFIAAVKRSIEGARLQRRRLAETHAQAPRLLEGTDHEVVDLTGLPEADLDYYIYELARLQDLARQVIKVFGSPPAIVDALRSFDDAIPDLRTARNRLTHPSNDARLDDFAWFGALVRLLPGGGVHYIVDPRDEHHEAAEVLAKSLLEFLRSGLREPGNSESASLSL